jgi:hypothetical protein
MILFLRKMAVFCVKNADFFGENIFKIKTLMSMKLNLLWMQLLLPSPLDWLRRRISGFRVLHEDFRRAR